MDGGCVWVCVCVSVWGGVLSDLGIKGAHSSSAVSISGGQPVCVCECVCVCAVMALFMDSDFSLLKPVQQKDEIDFKTLFEEQDQCKGKSDII